MGRPTLIAAVDWNSVAVAGAFVIGAIAGTIATMRVMRITILFLREMRNKDEDPDTK